MRLACMMLCSVFLVGCDQALKDENAKLRKELEETRAELAKYKPASETAGVGKAQAPSNKVAVAKASVSALESACNDYKKQFSAFPETLNQLLNPPDKGKPFVDSINDPWGKQFLYNPSGPKHLGSAPDIYTVDPDGKTIGNW